MIESRAVIRLCAVVWLAMFAGLPELAAQVTIPTLGGHRFVATESVDDPFVETHFLSQLGVGVATSSEFPLFVFEGDTVNAPRGTQLFTVVRFDYQQRVQEWLSARLSFETLARMGTDAISLLGAGVTAATTMRLDWKISVLRSERTNVAVDVGILNQNTTYVDIAGFVRDVIDREDASLVGSVPAIRAALGLRYAYAFSSVVGVTASADLLFGADAQDRESDSSMETSLGGGISVNGYSKGLPVAGFIGYSFSSDSFDQRAPNNTSHAVEFKIIYSVPGDFMIGPAISWSRLPGFNEGRVTFLNASLRSRYYF